MSTWTPDMDETLTDLRAQGVTSSQIAARISAATGQTLTRNAIIGRARRIGAPAVNLPSHKRPSTKKPSNRRLCQTPQSDRASDEYWHSLLSDPTLIKTDHARHHLKKILAADIDESGEPPLDVMRSYPAELVLR